MAEAIKEEGNSRYRAKDAAGALEKYEQALGLLVFAVNDGNRVVVSSPVSRLPGEAVTLAGLCTESPPADNQPTRALLEVLYLNIAASALALQDFSLAFEATMDVLRLNPRSAKAYFRRAEARVGAAGPNVTEQENALHDFRAAAALEPSNERYATALARQFASLRQTDSDACPGLDVQAQVECLLDLHRSFLDEGREEEARQLHRHVRRLQTESFLRRDGGQQQNLRHPTTELIDKATAHGCVGVDFFFANWFHLVTVHC